MVWDEHLKKQKIDEIFIYNFFFSFSEKTVLDKSLTRFLVLKKHVRLNTAV